MKVDDNLFCPELLRKGSPWRNRGSLPNEHITTERVGAVERKHRGREKGFKKDISPGLTTLLVNTLAWERDEAAVPKKEVAVITIISIKV